MSPTWRRRVVRTAAAYLVVAVVLVWTGTQPALLVIAGAFTFALLLGCYAVDRSGEATPEQWPTASADQAGVERGTDHATRALALRLAGAGDAVPAARTALGERVRADLVSVVTAEVERRFGAVDLTDPRHAAALLSPAVASLTLGTLPAERLTDPEVLDNLLTEIEAGVLADGRTAPWTPS